MIERSGGWEAIERLGGRWGAIKRSGWWMGIIESVMEDDKEDNGV